MTELKRCPHCGSKAVYVHSMAYDWAKCGNMNCHNTATISVRYWNTRPIEDELNARIVQLTAEIKRLKAVLNEWDMAWLTDCIAPQANGNEAFGLDEGLALSARMMKPILEETRLLLGKAEVVR